MNRKGFIFLLMAALVGFGLSSCSSKNGADDVNNLKDSLDWEGVYTGSFMTDSGNVLNVWIKLNRDQSFESTYQYADGSYNTIYLRGRFKWDDTGSNILIDVIDAPMQYKAAKNRLIRQDVYKYELEKVQ